MLPVVCQRVANDSRAALRPLKLLPPALPVLPRRPYFFVHATHPSCLPVARNFLLPTVVLSGVDHAHTHCFAHPHPRSIPFLPAALSANNIPVVLLLLLLFCSPGRLFSCCLLSYIRVFCLARARAFGLMVGGQGGSKPLSSLHV